MTESAPAVRIALVTGAAQGIGLTIALRLAEDGLDVAVNDLASKSGLLDTAVSQIKAKGRRSIAIHADVSQEAEVRDMVSQAVDQLGGLDVMVANAGIITVRPLVESSTEEWDRIMAVNVRSVMLSYKYAAIQMIKQGRGGRILGACSVAGKKGVSGLSAYSSSKFAVRGLTQSAALELSTHSITVNAYAPSLIKSSMGDALVTGWEASGLTIASTQAGDPEVVASLVSYLAKPESYFITGQTISPNGGFLLD